MLLWCTKDKYCCPEEKRKSYASDFGTVPTSLENDMLLDLLSFISIWALSMFSCNSSAVMWCMPLVIVNVAIIHIRSNRGKLNAKDLSCRPPTAYQGDGWWPLWPLWKLMGRLCSLPWSPLPDIAIMRFFPQLSDTAVHPESRIWWGRRQPRGCWSTWR